MRNKRTGLALAFAFAGSVAAGQSTPNTEKVVTRPKYSSNGQICEMRLYPNLNVANDNNGHARLPFDDFRREVDQIVPLDERGVKGQPFYRGWATGGGAIWAIFTYEKVRIVYAATFKVDPNAWKSPKPFVFSGEARSPERTPPANAGPEDDFNSYRNSSAETVTITWLDRKCVEK
jgi:hypothetical protein